MYLCLFSRFDRRALKYTVEWSNTGATGLMYRVYRKYTVKRAFVIPLGGKIPLVHRCPPRPHPAHNFTTTTTTTTTTNTLPTGSSLAEEYTWATDSETLSTSDNRPHHDEGAVPEENGGLGELRTMIIVDRQHTAYSIPSVIAAESRSFALLLHQIDYQTRTRRADIISSFKPCGHLLHSLEAQYTVLQQ